MPRGQQYYDPIRQVPSKAPQSADERIELFPEGDVTDASSPQPLRWVARLIGADGLIVEKTAGSFDHDDALRDAQERWPGLDVYELREESEDSTHQGFGPSPRLWSHAQEFGENNVARRLAEVVDVPVPPAVEPEQQAVHVIQVSATGTYIVVADVLAVLEHYARQFDADSNPSAALGIREAARAIAEAF